MWVDVVLVWYGTVKSVTQGTASIFPVRSSPLLTSAFCSRPPRCLFNSVQLPEEGDLIHCASLLKSYRAMSCCAFSSKYLDPRRHTCPSVPYFCSSWVCNNIQLLGSFEDCLASFLLAWQIGPEPWNNSKGHSFLWVCLVSSEATAKIQSFWDLWIVVWHFFKPLLLAQSLVIYFFFLKK